jgi:TetR/AcrR family transcriptional regulator, cholesterol catabolism regulator
MRDEVKGFKRELILEAATKLFYERGFAGATMQAVADRLQVTKPFIYSYFKDKNALLAAIYDRSTEPVMRELDRMLESEGPPTARFAAFIEQFAHMNMRYRIVSTIFLREEKHLSKETLRKLRNFEHSFDAKLTKLIQRGIDIGEFQVRDAQLTSLAIGGMIRWMHRWYREDGRVPADEIARFMADLALCAVLCSRAEPKRKRASRRASVR